jgi:hypothetical protein
MLLCAWLCAMALVVAAKPVQAQTQTQSRTWVSSAGADSGSCPQTSPCATFAYAIQQTTSGGEIDCLSGGDFGAVIITQSITIDCGGGQVGSIGVSGYAELPAIGFQEPTRYAINLNLSTSGLVVLRNLSIRDFGGVLVVPILTTSFPASTLIIEHCKISNFTDGSGMLFEPSSSPSQLFVSDTIIDNNGESGLVAAGIYIKPASGVTATVSINRSEIKNNEYGIIADSTAGGSIRGVVKDSVVSGNSQNGITASSSGASDVLTVNGTDASSNGNHGLVAGGSGAGMLVRNSTVFNNGGGLYTTGGGTLYSYGNNSVNGNNGNDGAFTGTVGQQ